MKKDFLINSLGLIGLTLIGLGLWLVDPAWSLVAVGCILFAGALVAHWID